MRKRNLILNTVVTILFIVIVLIVCDKVDERVVRKGLVVESAGDTLTIWDDTGVEWKYETKEKFEDNQRVKIIINNNNTIDKLEDDVVVRVKRLKKE